MPSTATWSPKRWRRPSQRTAGRPPGRSSDAVEAARHAPRPRLSLDGLLLRQPRRSSSTARDRGQAAAGRRASSAIAAASTATRRSRQAPTLRLIPADSSRRAIRRSLIVGSCAQQPISVSWRTSVLTVFAAEPSSLGGLRDRHAGAAADQPHELELRSGQRRELDRPAARAAAAPADRGHRREQLVGERGEPCSAARRGLVADKSRKVGGGHTTTIPLAQRSSSLPGRARRRGKPALGASPARADEGRRATPAHRYDASCAVAVAQLVEPRVVVPVVAGSNPVRHPRPRSSADRAAAFEAASGGSTPPGAAFTASRPPAGRAREDEESVTLADDPGGRAGAGQPPARTHAVEVWNDYDPSQRFVGDLPGRREAGRDGELGRLLHHRARQAQRRPFGQRRGGRRSSPRARARCS